MWNLDFRPRTMLWLLIAAGGLGLGIRVTQFLRGRAVDFPLTVVSHSDEARALRREADSLMAARATLVNAPININTADAAQFEALDGIGKTLAARMVAYRTEHGLFKSVDELDYVSGIGPKRLEAIRRRCFVDSLPTPASDSAH